MELVGLQQQKYDSYISCYLQYNTLQFQSVPTITSHTFAIHIHNHIATISSDSHIHVYLCTCSTDNGQPQLFHEYQQLRYPIPHERVEEQMPEPLLYQVSSYTSCMLNVHVLHPHSVTQLQSHLVAKLQPPCSLTW